MVFELPRTGRAVAAASLPAARNRSIQTSSGHVCSCDTGHPANINASKCRRVPVAATRADATFVQNGQDSQDCCDPRGQSGGGGPTAQDGCDRRGANPAEGSYLGSADAVSGERAPVCPNLVDLDRRSELRMRVQSGTGRGSPGRPWHKAGIYCDGECRC